MAGYGYGDSVPPVPVRLASVKSDKNGASQDGKKKRWFKGSSSSSSNPGEKLCVCVCVCVCQSKPWLKYVQFPPLLSLSKLFFNIQLLCVCIYLCVVF